MKKYSIVFVFSIIIIIPIIWYGCNKNSFSEEFGKSNASKQNLEKISNANSDCDCNKTNTITPTVRSNNVEFNDFVNAKVYNKNSSKICVLFPINTKYPQKNSGLNNIESNWILYQKSINNISNPRSYNSPQGNCVWWAWLAATVNWNIALNITGNANTWENQLIKQGFKSSSTFIQNSLGCFTTINHVAWVENKMPCKVLVSEMNYNYGNGSLIYGRGMRYQLYDESIVRYLTPPAVLASPITYSSITKNGKFSGQFDIANVSNLPWTGDLILALHIKDANNNDIRWLQDICQFKGLTLNSNSRKTLTFKDVLLWAQIPALKSGQKIKLVLKTIYNGTYPELPATWKYNNSTINNQVVTIK